MFNPETGAYVPKRGADLHLTCATLDFDPDDYPEVEEDDD